MNRALFCAIQRARQMSLSLSLSVHNRGSRRSFVHQLAGRLFILFSRGEKEYKVVPWSVGEAVGRAWSTAVYAKPPRLATPCLPVCVFARYVDTSTCLRRGSARLSSARLRCSPNAGGGELEGSLEERRATSRECNEDEGMRRGRARYTAKSTDERDTLPYRTAPHRATPAGGYEPVAAVAAVNRTGALNPRRPRRSRSRPYQPSSAPTTLSKRPDRFTKLRSRRERSSLNALRENVRARA